MTSDALARTARTSRAARRWQTVALLLVALTMGLEFAHVLEWAPKANYPGHLYARLQETLYVGFGTVGAAVWVLAIVASIATAVAMRRSPRNRRLTWAAAGLELAAQAVFLVVVYPVNQRFPVHTDLTVPADWAALRDRWESGHATGFVLFTLAFLLLLAAREPETDP